MVVNKFQKMFTKIKERLRYLHFILKEIYTLKILRLIYTLTICKNVN